MEDKQKLKKRHKLGDVLDLISDIVMIPLILLTLVCCLSVFVMQQNNKTFNVLGYTVVEVLSPSMVASGFEVGDNAIIKYHDPETFEKGDIIAFYYHIETAKTFDVKNASRKPLLDGTLVASSSSYAAASASQKLAAKAGSRIYFHEIVDIAVDDNGDLWFQTKGTSNATPDSYWTRQDFILGSYVEGSHVITNFLNFLTTTTALVWMLIVPNGVSFMLYMIPFWNYIDIFMLEKKVLKGELSAYDELCIEMEVVSGMDNKQKQRLMQSVANSNYRVKDDMLEQVCGMRWEDLSTSTNAKLIKRYKQYF